MFAFYYPEIEGFLDEPESVIHEEQSVDEQSQVNENQTDDAQTEDNQSPEDVDDIDSSETSEADAIPPVDPIPSDDDGTLKDENGFSKSLVESSPKKIPEYSGEDYIILNKNKPRFNEYDIANLSGEEFSELDELGRCGIAKAMIDKSMMPTAERGAIGMVKPSGWHTIKYPDVVPGLYLYNRCHLIGYELTGQNANELNLITGTRYFNVSIMLIFENEVANTLENTDNRVLYRVSPLFKDDELVARGVEIEAYSVEDKGKSLSIHVFCYNIQPGIGIDYKTGDSWVL